MDAMHPIFQQALEPYASPEPAPLPQAELRALENELDAIVSDALAMAFEEGHAHD
jgi:hypothetical protein